MKFLSGMLAGLSLILMALAGCAENTTPTSTPTINSPAISRNSPIPAASPPPVATPISPEVPRLLLWDGSYVAQVKQRVLPGDAVLEPAVARLLRDADAAMKLGPFSVMNKKGMPPSGNKHDYFSLSIYYWPDPKSTSGRPYISRDGQVNPEANGDYYDAASMSGMVSAVSTLSLAGYILENNAYGSRAAQLLQTWFIDPATRMNPNLNYGQSVPGKSDGTPSGIIETGRLLEVLDAVGLLSPNVWDSGHRQALQGWFAEYLAWLQNSPNGRSESKAKNNHATWYDAQAVAYSLFTGNNTLAKEILQSRVPVLIAAQIEPDGRQPLEIARTRSLHYSLYNLEAYISLAMLGEQARVDLWRYATPDGRGIRKALDFVIPYLSGGQWPYPDISTQSEKGFAGYLRRAAIGFQEKAYAGIGENLLGQSAADRLNLLCPKP